MFDPNAPAFGAGAQKPEDLQEDAKPTDKAEAQPVEEGEIEDDSDEKSKVSYSRFKKFHDLAKESQAEAERLRAEAEEWKRKANAIESKESTSEMPDFWKELYGDSEASKKAWQIQSRANHDLVEQAKREAREAIREETRAETERVEQNLENIDSSLDSLNDYAGRVLTEAEQSAVLDIVEEYSPKDDYGNFIATIPFEKAFDLLEVKQQASKTSKVQSRNNVASLTNTKTQGAPSDDQVERNKNFNPLDWGAALRRLNN